MATWRDDIRQWLIQHAGHVWYGWGAQDLPGGAADCSGLVIELLKQTGRITEHRYDATAQGLAERYQVGTDAPLCGDLCFYGHHWKQIKHVMIFVGELRVDHVRWPETVAGMVHGTKETTPTIGRLFGRGLFFRPSPWYRKDYLGARKVP